MTVEEYMNRVAEKTLDNSKQLRRDVHQRRNGMEDLYGVCFSAHATEANEQGRYEARFYISLSPDYVYIHRFAFKFVIMPSIVQDEDPSEGRDWKVYVGKRDDDTLIDITAYLEEQQGVTPLFSGEGIYPKNDELTDGIENFYDILDVTSVMIAEGQDVDDESSDVHQILKPNFKPVVISSKKPFSADSYLYLKYSNTNR